MNNQHLKTYLNDHLAGAAAALELLKRMEESHSSEAVQKPLAQLRAEIMADRDELKRLMSRLEIPESRPRQAMGWLAEKMAQVKLRLDDPSDGALRQFEALEALALGIDGKRALWCALAKVAEAVPAADFQRLQRRAEEQRARVEDLRLQAAESALCS